MTHINRRDLLVIPAAAAGATALAAFPAGAQTTPPVQAAPSAYAYKVGDIDIFAVFDGKREGALEPGFVTNAPIEAVREAMTEAMRPADKLENPFTPTLIKTGGRLVLIDTGLGQQPPESPLGRLVPNLRGIGVAPEDIGLVIISHFHGDHISGLKTPEGGPVYPNAEVVVPEAELAFWLDAGEESRAPEARKASFATARRIFGGNDLPVRPYKDGEELAPGVTALAAFGHSPGHMAYRVESGSQGLLLISDAAHLPFLFVRNPEWSPAFDMDPEMARETRRRLLEMAAADRIPAAGYHWGFPNVGHVKPAGDGYDLIRLPWPT